MNKHSTLLLTLSESTSRKPSLYEIIICNQLYAFFGYLQQSGRNASGDGSWNNDFLELLALAINMKFVYSTDSTFVERMYGLRRVGFIDQNEHALTSAQKLYSLVQVFGLDVINLLDRALENIERLPYFQLISNSGDIQQVMNSTLTSAIAEFEQEPSNRSLKSSTIAQLFSSSAKYLKAFAQLHRLVRLGLRLGVSHSLRGIRKVLFPAMRVIWTASRVLTELRYGLGASQFIDPWLAFGNVHVIKRNSTQSAEKESHISGRAAAAEPKNDRMNLSWLGTGEGAKVWSLVACLVAIKVFRLLASRSSESFADAADQFPSNSSILVDSDGNIDAGVSESECDRPDGCSLSYPAKPRLAPRRENEDQQYSCPICHLPVLLPTAAPGGVVCCYRCLLSICHSDSPKCPWSGLPCHESNLIRLH